jgi:hypothetical protein
MKTLIRFQVILLVVVMSVACTTQRKVKRISPDQQVDLSGRWNDTDSKQTAEAMIQQIINHRWIDDYRKNNEGERPKVIVGLIKNKSHEHINPETFVKDVEKSFIKTGAVRLIQGGEKRNEIRGERADQQEFASPETVKNWGKELGADFMLQGSINSIVDSYKNEKVVYYQVDLELTNLETNEVVWMGDKKIKKYVEN